MRPLSVVLLSPSLDLLLCILQCCKPVRIQTFIAEPPVEALYMPVLHGLARRDVNELHFVFVTPAQEMGLVNSGPLSQRSVSGAPR